VEWYRNEKSGGRDGRVLARASLPLIASEKRYRVPAIATDERSAGARDAIRASSGFFRVKGIGEA